MCTHNQCFEHEYKKKKKKKKKNSMKIFNFYNFRKNLFITWECFVMLFQIYDCSVNANCISGSSGYTCQCFDNLSFLPM